MSKLVATSAELFSEIQTKQQTAVAVNAALIMMYWQIGQRINQEQIKLLEMDDAGIHVAEY
jgi:hypothetical protein